MQQITVQDGKTNESSALLQKQEDEIEESVNDLYLNKENQEPQLDIYRQKRRCCPTLQYRVAEMLFLLRSYASITITPNVCIVTTLAVLGTFLCDRYNLHADLPVSLLATSIIFPFSFGIGFTFNRRHNALIDMADLKTASMGLYLSIREWTADKQDGEKIAEQTRLVLRHLLHEISMFIMNKEHSADSVYASFDNLAGHLEALRKSDDFVRAVIARAYQYLREMLADFEKLRLVHDYRTPSTMRSYGFVFLLLFPVLFSPLFAKYAKDNGAWVGYYCSAFSSLMLVNLYNILSDAEDPFDGTGIDDLNPNILSQAYLHMTKKIKQK